MSFASGFPREDDRLLPCVIDEVGTFDRSSLKPTTTVVRDMPVIVSGAEAGALKPAYEDTMDDKAAPSGAGAGAGDAGEGKAGEEAAASATTKPSRRSKKAAGMAKVTVQDDVEDVAEVHGYKFIDRVCKSVKAGKGAWAAAPRIVKCDDEARPGYATKKAHEYHDTPETLKAKVKELAKMIRASESVVAYTGAGISTASGIADYASKSKDSHGAGRGRPKLRSPLEAQPTLTHHVLASMVREKHLHYWIQQNHDGLPQKAGCPQEVLNEIHGAWYDVSNPVVPMSGSLRDDLFSDLLEWEDRADLVLALGTSMCGMNADRVATTCAERSLTNESQGAVIVSLQRTQYDSVSSLRIYAKIDAVFTLLHKELGLTDAVRASMRAAPFKLPKSMVRGSAALRAAGMRTSLRTAMGGSSAVASDDDVFVVPYNAKTGKYERGAKTVLDLREGARVRLTGGMYKGEEGKVIGSNLEGHWRVQLQHAVSKKRPNKKVPFVRMLGSWWAEAAVKGTVPIIPVVNVASKK